MNQNESSSTGFMSTTDSPPVGFASLPSELRLKIWHATFRPRVVQIYPKPDRLPVPTLDINSNRIVTNIKWERHCPNPASLFVCRESRLEAERFYTTKIGTHGHRGSIFVNPLLDTIYLMSLRWPGHLTFFLQDWCISSLAPNPIQSVAVDPNFFLRNRKEILYQSRAFRPQFLRTLTLVIEEHGGALHENSHFFSRIRHSALTGDEYAEVEFGPPETETELKCWEGYRYRADSIIRRCKEILPWADTPDLRVVMARRGPKAKGLDPAYCNMQGPIRNDYSQLEM